MFKRFREIDGESVAISLDGVPLPARAGDTVSAAIAAADIAFTRTTPVTGARRSAYCMMGVCFECLVTIDGVGNQQGCLIPVRDGMKVERQIGRREIGK